MLMKIKLTLLFCALFFLVAGLGSAYFFITEVEALLNPLTERVRLIGYLNYLALFGLIPISISLIFASVYSLVTDTKIDPYCGVGKAVTYSFFCGTLLFVLLGLAGRVYKGIRVDDAGYVKCAKESRTSSKSSWRVYAKSLDLCKDSSGIAGG